MSYKLHRKQRREIKRKQERKKLRMMQLAADQHNKVKSRANGMLYQKAQIDPVSDYKAAKERKRELIMMNAQKRRINRTRNHL